MSSDDVGAPLWGSPLPNPLVGSELISAADIARKAGVSMAAMERALAHLVAQGSLIAQVSPLCQHCGAEMGHYLSTEDMPDEIKCSTCGHLYHISEIMFRLAYVVVEAPKD